jgi:murein DD-endopeptidase MepM/ murein hydrolase activator NlpD
MSFINSLKLTLSKYYPRDHLILASCLSLVLVVTLVLAPEESAHGARFTVTPLSNNGTDSPPGHFGPEHSDTAHNNENKNSSAVDSFWTKVEVQAGDNLSTLFTQVGLSPQDMYKVLNSSEEAKVLNRIFPGYELSFHMPELGKLAQLKVLKSPVEGYMFTLNKDNYEVEPISREAEIIPTLKKGVISDSLFMAGQRAKIPAVSIMEMADIFGGVIDFILDPRDGDSFSILYEERYLDGNFIGNGEIIAAEFTNQGKQYIAVRYINENGESGYYNPEGESMRKAFLRTPLDVFRISSNFNLSRKHPILNTIRAHRGTDYAAPHGTPVRATSDGEVTWAARNGSFGKLIVLKHRGQFETKYAHLHDYASGIKKGARVKQGQIIGYVGTTGSSTGPHLHYEFLVGGEHKDPSKIVGQLPQAVSIDPTELARFKSETSNLVARFVKTNTDTRLLSLNEIANQNQTNQTH